MSYYTSAITLAGSCFWCERPFAREFGPKTITRDYLIPQWACRLFYVELGWANAAHNVVKACSSCNAAKGGMPPETFHRVRDKVGTRKTVSVYWHQVQQQVCTAWTSGEGKIDPGLKAFIIKEMLKPVPVPAREASDRYASGAVPQATVIPVGPPGEPFSKNKPLQRLYSLADHEKLNENLDGVR